MDFTHDNEEAFNKQHKILLDTYEAYRSSLTQRLWYAEFRTGQALTDMLSLKVETRGEYWGRNNPYISAIQRNVWKHLRLSEAGKEKSRLGPAGLSDERWRKAEPQLWAEIVQRYGQVVEPFNIDQTVSVVSISNSRFSVQRSCYLDQFGSNIFCDEELEDGSTLRQLDADNGALRPLSGSALANTIGVAAIFVDRDGTPILRWRKHDNPTRRMAVMEAGWHCTTSGVLTWQDFIGDKGHALSVDGVVRGIARETNREAGLFSHELVGDEPMFSIHPIAFARELKRAGKPQFFFVIKFPHHTAVEIVKEVISRYKIEGDEYGGKRKSLLGRIFKFKPTEDEGDFRIDDRLNLKKLTRSELCRISQAEPENPFTFESYGNLFFACKE